MAFERAASDFEACLRAFAQEFYRVVSVVDEGYEQVARFVHECSHLAEFGSSDPVKLLLEDSRIDAGEKQLLLAESSEVKEVDVDLEAVHAAPCKDVFLEHIKSRLFDIHDHIDCRDLSERSESGRDVAEELLNLPLAECRKDCI